MPLVEGEPYRNALLWHDYFLLLLFTGMRKTEAGSLRWEDIDLKSKTLTIQDTKNREIHTLPMSDFIYELLERRNRHRTNEFIFPEDSKTGYIYEPKKAVLKDCL
ncbi:MAG: hypothetical protein A3F46_04240 [Legionellales bacterium RIFCSPHIGHO2_12_FULL_42_9]|nr:MAG: hypothetical protein A3F46_04240 [Legionellales bacterium RIFCSPHIGHO2_12_FULL_42_9]